MLTTIMGLCLVLPGAGQADGDERLLGSRVSVQEAVSRAQIIVVAEVADLGSAKPGPPGIAWHLGVKLKPSRGACPEFPCGDKPTGACRACPGPRR